MAKGMRQAKQVRTYISYFASHLNMPITLSYKLVINVKMLCQGFAQRMFCWRSFIDFTMR